MTALRMIDEAEALTRQSCTGYCRIAVLGLGLPSAFVAVGQGFYVTIYPCRRDRTWGTLVPKELETVVARKTCRPFVPAGRILTRSWQRVPEIRWSLLASKALGLGRGSQPELLELNVAGVLVFGIDYAEPVTSEIVVVKLKVSGCS